MEDVQKMLILEAISLFFALVFWVLGFYALTQELSFNSSFGVAITLTILTVVVHFVRKNYNK